MQYSKGEKNTERRSNFKKVMLLNLDFVDFNMLIPQIVTFIFTGDASYEKHLLYFAGFKVRA